jgi:hypothetical protein
MGDKSSGVESWAVDTNLEAQVRRTPRVKVPPRLWKAIGAVEIAGIKLSNIAFNLSQGSSPLDQRSKQVMTESQMEWDEAQRHLAKLLR